MTEGFTGVHALLCSSRDIQILVNNQMNSDKRDRETRMGRQDSVDTIPVRRTGENISVSMAAMETQLPAYNKKRQHGNEDREAPLPPHI